LKVAAILDEFTTECFKYEVELITFTPQNWESILSGNIPHLLFVESCWFGNNNSWGTLIESKKNNHIEELKKLLSFCTKHNIPSVFWCKEDPTHYQLFSPIATLFEYVFTSDENMIPSYKKDYGIEAYPLSFFCQPKIHNPIELLERKNKAVFAGTYYAQKPERCDDFNNLILALEMNNIGYDIYDRCYNRQMKAFEFPEKYKSNILGYLPPEDIWKAYKGYKYQINLNSVKDSPTMFARRVYESLACGTPVISNYSIGVEKYFGDIVICSDDPKEISKKLLLIENDPASYKKTVEAGIRRVLSYHTLEERMVFVLSKIYTGTLIEKLKRYVTIFAFLKDDEDYFQALYFFNNQTYQDKELVFLLLGNIDSLFEKR